MNFMINQIDTIGDIKMAKKKKKEEPKLIDVLYKQLSESDNFVKIHRDSFSDGSGSWIDCYHETLPDSKGKRYMKHLSFNGDGTILEDVQVWSEKMVWDEYDKQLR